MRLRSTLGCGVYPFRGYKERIGTSELHSILFDLEQLFQVADNLHCLDKPFSEEEIDAVVKNLPNDKSNDKSPDPNGFNSDFIKRCWSIIK